MHSEQQLSWLNVSVQLVLSNHWLVEGLVKTSFFISTAQNTSGNHISTAVNTQQDNDVLLDNTTTIQSKHY